MKDKSQLAQNLSIVSILCNRSHLLVSLSLLEILILKLFFWVEKKNNLLQDFDKLLKLNDEIQALRKKVNRFNMEKDDLPSALFYHNTENFNLWIMIHLGFDPSLMTKNEALESCVSFFKDTDTVNKKQLSMFQKYYLLQKKYIQKVNAINAHFSGTRDILFLAIKYLYNYPIELGSDIHQFHFYFLLNISVAACREVYPDIFKNLLKDLAGTIELACHNVEITLMKWLIEQSKLKINSFTHKGMTPLMHACKENALPIVIYLISNPKIDLNLATPYGINALHIACCEGNNMIVKELLSHSIINVNACLKASRWGIPLSFAGNPFIISLINRKFDLVELFLSDKRFIVHDSSEVIMLLASDYPNKRLQLKHLKLLLKTGCSLKLDLKVGWYHIEMHAIQFARILNLHHIEKYLTHLCFPQNRFKSLKGEDIEIITNCVFEPSLNSSNIFNERFNIHLYPEDTLILFKGDIHGFLKNYLIKAAKGL